MALVTRAPALDVCHMILVPTYSPCSLRGDALLIDRKLHTGICEYVEGLGCAVTVLAPALSASDRLMDGVELQVASLPYRVAPVDCDGSFRVRDVDRARVRALVREADLVYGVGFGVAGLARRLKTPYVAVAEYNWRTQVVFAQASVAGPLRRAVRAARAWLRFRGDVRDRRLARAVHCNGFPVYEECARINPERLLYLDSRMTAGGVIAEATLSERLARVGAGRRPRLLFSGRFTPGKGVMDAVEVGVLLAQRGVDFEFDFYGQGSEGARMRDRVRAAGLQDHIHIHDPIPFPELMTRAQTYDVFLCCHLQDDPSCTYLEASGAGLPIVGYGNRMWSAFAAAACNGVVTQLSSPASLADAVAALLGDHDRLAAFAWRSRAFALDHCFEREFDKRIGALKRLVVELGIRG